MASQRVAVARTAIRLTKLVPPALQWVVRRALADASARHGTARELRADLQALAAAEDPWRVQPADLPSMQWRPFWPGRRDPAGLAAQA